MATLSSARQTYKSSGATTDCWCLRIQMEDGTRVSITDAVEDLTVTERIKSDGSSESVASRTYFSVANKLSAVNKSEGMEPGTMDLELLLGDSTAVESFTDSKLYDNTEIVESVSVTKEAFGNKDALVDGDLVNAGNTDPTITWTPSNSRSNTDPATITIKYKNAIHLDKVKLYSHSTTAGGKVGFSVSKDGYRFIDILPIQNDPVADIKEFSFPDVVRANYLKVKYGTVSSTEYLREIEVLEEKTVSNRGYLTRNDILSGRMKNARVYVFLTDYTNPKEDDEKMMAGFVREIEMRDGRMTALLSSLLDVMDHRSTRVFSASCDAQLGEFRCGVRLFVPEWTNGMYAVARLDGDASTGTIVKPTVENGRYFKCVTGDFVTGSVEPSWNTVVGGFTTDDNVTWETILAWTYTRTIGAVTSDTRLEISGISDFGSDWWANGYVEFLDGDLSGTKHKIQSSDTGGIDLQQGLSVTPSVGDSIRLVVGCDKRYIVCSDKFDNLDNFQGFRDLPGQRIIGKFGGQ